MFQVACRLTPQMKRVRRDLSTPSQTRLLTRLPSVFLPTHAHNVYCLHVPGPHPRRRWAVGEAHTVFYHPGYVGPHAHILVVGQNILRHWLEVWVGHRPCRLDQKCVRARRKIVSCAGCLTMPPKRLRWHGSDWSNECPVARTHSLSLDSLPPLLTRFAPLLHVLLLHAPAWRHAPSLHRYITRKQPPEQTSPSGVTFASTAARKRP